MGEYEGVEDTLFIPLAARIYVSKRFPQYFYDEKALELEASIPNKIIAEKYNEYNMLLSVARYRTFDEIAQKFIDRHENCNIVNLGVGLETSYHRLNRKNAFFLEVDLPDVIELRQNFMEAGENEKFVAGDLFKLDWVEDIDTSLPTLMIVSGVFQYFHENDILKFIRDTKDVFENAELVFDTTTKNGLKYTNYFVKKSGNTSALMYFYVNDNEEFAKKTGTRLIEKRVFFENAEALSNKISFVSKVSMKFCDRFNLAKILHLRY